MQEQQWQDCLHQYSKKLLHLSYLYVKDWHSAEDIVQDVFITYFEKETQFRGDSTLETYLTRMTINRSKDYLKSWRYRTMTLTNFFPQTMKMKNSLIEEEERSEVVGAVFRLPIKYRELIILHFYEHHSLIAISKLLNVPSSTVHNRFLKAKKLLREQINRQEWEGLFHE